MTTQTPFQRGSNNEIDLFDLVIKIWQAKWTIIVISMLTIILAGVYAFTAKEQWTATAQIRTPEARELQNYLNIQQAYHHILNPGSTLDAEERLEEAFSVFSHNLFSKDERLEAISNTLYYKTQAEHLEDEVARLNLLNSMASKDFSVKVEEGVGEHALYNISFSAETGVDAQTTLIQAIESINDKALNLLYERLEGRINYQLSSLEAQSQSIKDSTDQEQKNQLEVLKQALQSARASGINDYSGSSPVAGDTIINLNDPNTLFMLGENYLQAQVDTLSNSNPVYSTKYYEILRNTEKLKTLLEPEITGQLFTFTEAPKLPLNKDKPRKGLILVLGAFLGGVIGIFYVLLRSAVRNRRAAQQA